MTVAVLSDVHDVAAADRIVLLGDVLAGPMPVETLTRLESPGSRAVWVRGNADRELAASARGAGDFVPDPILPWAAKQLRPGDLPFLGPTARRQPAGLRAHAHAVRAPGRPTADRQPGQHRNALRRKGCAMGLRRTEYDAEAACRFLAERCAYPDVEALRVFSGRGTSST